MTSSAQPAAGADPYGQQPGSGYHPPHQYRPTDQYGDRRAAEQPRWADEALGNRATDRSPWADRTSTATTFQPTSTYPSAAPQPGTSYHPPRVPGQYQPAGQYQQYYASLPYQSAQPGYGYPPGLPPRRNRRRAWPAVVTVLVLLLLLASGGAAMAATVLKPSGGMARSMAPGAVGTAPAAPRDKALVELLTRHAAAVKAKDQNAFLADVDKTDATFLAKQQTIFQNLMKLPLADFAYKLVADEEYDEMVPATLRSKYGTSVRAPGVTVTYQITDVDTGPVAVPWVPVFATVDDRWVQVGELPFDKELPSGIGGQAWDGGAITVAKSASGRVVGVFSNTGRDNPQKILALADKALDRVAVVRPAGWVGKIFVIAVRDKKVFDAYFGDNPDRVEQVAAIAVPHYTDVHDWSRSAKYSATRIVFNPDELDGDTQVLGDDLTHEFTHAAMAPVTSGWTPTWLVEGFAEYVSYNKQQIDPAALKKALKDAKTEDLFANDKFYDDPLNYLTGWLACRMISEKFGQAKLIELYEAFENSSNETSVVSKVLGLDRADLITQWQAYVAKQRK